MLLTIIIAALAACGVWMLLLALKEALLPRPDCAYHVICLRPDRPEPTAQVQACLWRRRSGVLTGTLLFVDGGLDAQTRAAIEQLLQKTDDAVLCTPEQAGILGNEERRSWNRS